MGTEWLPALLLFGDHAGDWDRYLDRLHSQFQNDFVDSLPYWPGKRVGIKRHPEAHGKSATFWHLISEGSIETERIPDMRRCERVAWPRPMMDEFDESEPDSTQCRIVWWKEVRRNEERYLLAPDDFSYLFVVADRGSYVLPWTAFWLEHDHQRQKRRRAFESYWGL